MTVAAASRASIAAALSSAGWAWAGSPGRTEKTSARTPTTQNRREQASRKPSFSADDGCGQDSVPATEDGRTTFPCWTRLAPEPDCDAAVAGHPHEVGLDERPYCATLPPDGPALPARPAGHGRVALAGADPGPSGRSPSGGRPSAIARPDHPPGSARRQDPTGARAGSTAATAGEEGGTIGCLPHSRAQLGRSPRDSAPAMAAGGSSSPLPRSFFIRSSRPIGGRAAWSAGRRFRSGTCDGRTGGVARATRRGEKNRPG